MSTPEKAPLPMQKPPSGNAPAGGASPPRPKPPAPSPKGTSATMPAITLPTDASTSGAPAASGAPAPVGAPAPRPPAQSGVEATTTPPIGATGPRLIQPPASPYPAPPPGHLPPPPPGALPPPPSGALPPPAAALPPPVAPPPRGPLGSVVSAPAAVSIKDAVPSLSDPELAHIARAVQGRDPEASLDIPPPTELTPPEDRAPDAKDPYIGTTFDHRYKIQKLLGEGGMGFVYLARHKVIDKKVAVKVLRADLAKDREILDRFLQEAKAASSIGNAHIVDISDFGDLPDSSTYFVMEYLEGKSLGELVDQGSRLPAERICHIALQICDGLSAAHARGIVHRDLKPDNIYLLERGADHDFVKILDFGIAKVSGNANTKLTKAGAVFGTPHYMSPEQAAGAPVDHRTDIYALGVILYEMVSGQLPFNADNFMGILTQHMYKAPVPIRALVSGVPGPECPPSLEAVILKCLSKKPEGRYQSMDELAADLDRVKSGGVANAVTEMMARSGGFNVPADYFKQPSLIVPATPHSQQKKWPRYAGLAGAGAAVIIVGAIFVISGITNGNPAPKGLGSSIPMSVTPPLSAAPTPSAAAPAAGKVTSIAVLASPETATVTRDGAAVKKVACSKGPNNLHMSCWTIDVDEGKPATVEIKADNYEPETRTLDATDLLTSVSLKPKATRGGGGVKAGPNVKGPATKPGGNGKSPGGDVITPKGYN